jgi:hypothetical protein
MIYSSTYLLLYVLVGNSEDVCTVFTIYNRHLFEYVFEITYVVLKDHLYKLLLLVHTG